ncbi:MAG: glycosyltransferase [Ignavibacteriales bacterium]|nr:glycosyltransferase [Ignavibacteriales bacterium]
MNVDLLLQAVLSTSAVFYSLVVLIFIIGLFRTKYARSLRTPRVSVIVAARNEEANLKALLPNLLTQDYPSFEIIIANDRSSDNTTAILNKYRQKFRNLKVVEITSTPKAMPPKKNALASAIKLSKGEILCFTDADCLPPKRWISEIVAAFDDTVGLVAGYSPYDGTLLAKRSTGFLKSLFQKFIAYEELKAAACSAGGIGVNKGWLCTGRNLAYRREVYDEVGGFERIKHSVSGDDDLFLQLVRRTTKWKIRYMTSPTSFVRTRPPGSFREFVEQRKRHFSAARYFPISMKVFFFLFHFSNLLLLLGLLGFFAGISGLALGLPTFAVKLAADVSLFLLIAEVFSQRGFGGYFLLMEILYIFYNTFIGPLGLVGSFQWKPEPKS